MVRKQLRILPTMPPRHQRTLDHRMWLLENAVAEAERIEAEKRARLLALLEEAAYSYVSPDEIAAARGDVDGESGNTSARGSESEAGWEAGEARDEWEDTRQHLEALTSVNVSRREGGAFPPSHTHRLLFTST
jgi:hypothetical protein